MSTGADGVRNMPRPYGALHRRDKRDRNLGRDRGPAAALSGFGMGKRAKLWAGAAALLAIGLTFRLWHVTVEPLWLDEAYSAYAADHGLAFIWQVTPGYEVHPPFYYTLLRLWTLAFGNGLAALRALGLVAGVALLPIMAAAGSAAGALLGWPKARGRWLALAAFGLACIDLPLIEMARQVRPYPIMTLAYGAALLPLIRLTRAAQANRPLGGKAYCTYLLLLEAMLWLHSLGPLYAAALALALAIGVLRRGMERCDWAWLIGGHALAGLLYLPALAILADQAPTWVKSTWLHFRVAAVTENLPMLYAVPGWQMAAAFLLAALAAVALARSGEGRRLLAMLLVLALVPTIAAILLSVTVAPVFLPRVLTSVAVPTILLLAIGGLSVTGGRRWLGLGALLILGVDMLALDAQARAAGPMQHWYEAVAWLSQRFRPEDQVFAYPNEGALPLSYALRDKGLSYPIRAIPTAVPAFDPTGWNPTGSRSVVSLPRWRLRQIADEPATRAVPTIWLLRLGANAYDHGDVFLQELHRGRYTVRSWHYGPIDIIGLAKRPPR
jgi:mannosyltransferase